MNVSLASVTKRFTATGPPAVLGATLTAPSGAITTLVGPSGSGKTTVLRIIAGLDSVDEGRVFFDEQDVTRVPVTERPFVFVCQNVALLNHMTVRDNIALSLNARRAAKTANIDNWRRVDELLELVQLQGLGDRYPLQLSEGPRQRLGFARALACRPRILLLDDPFAGLDSRIRTEHREWFARLHETTHLTTILVTDDQLEARALSQKIVVMDRGRVVQVGTPSDVYDEPKPPSSAEVRDGAWAQGIVRSREVPPGKDGGEGRDSLATITRVVGVGSHVELQLALRSAAWLTVQVPRAEAESKHWAVGDRVTVHINDAKVFIGGRTVTAAGREDLEGAPFLGSHI